MKCRFTKEECDANCFNQFPEMPCAFSTTEEVAEDVEEYELGSFLLSEQ